MEKLRLMWIFSIMFSITLLAMAQSAHDNEAFATHMGDARTGHPYIPPIDSNGEHYNIYLDLALLQAYAGVKLATT